MTWHDLAFIQQRAATLLGSCGLEGAERPACGRAYYAAYSLVTHRLAPIGIAYAHGWNNPAHADLPRYVNMIAGLSPIQRQAIRRALRRLRQRREDADYRPRITIDRSAARQSLSDMHQVFRILGEGV